MASSFCRLQAGLVIAAPAPIGPYSNTQVLIGVGVLSALIVIVAISIWRRGRKG